jgi:hypothetical protein
MYRLLSKAQWALIQAMAAADILELRLAGARYLLTARKCPKCRSPYLTTGVSEEGRRTNECVHSIKNIKGIKPGCGYYWEDPVELKNIEDPKFKKWVVR